MNFTKVNISIPEEIKRVLAEIHSVQKNAVIAGGYLADLYMEKQHKDIDIFILSNTFLDEKIKKRFKSYELEETNELSQSNYDDLGISDVRYYAFEGEHVQLIFTKYGKDVVEYFDYRFREFYFDGIYSYASIEAIHDINNHTLYFGVTTNPIRSLFRGLQFEERYKFNLEPKSLVFLKSLFDYSEVTEKRLLDYIDSRSLQKEISDKMLSFYKEHEIEGIFQFNHCFPNKMATKWLFNMDVPRDYVEKVYSHIPIQFGNIPFTFNENPYTLKKLTLLKNIYEGFSMIRFLLITDLKKYKKKWSDYISKYKNVTEFEKIFLTFYNEVDKEMLWNDKEYLNEFRNLLYQYKLFLNREKVHCDKDILIMVSNHTNLDCSFSIFDWLDGHIVELKVNSESHILYDLNKDKLLHSNMDNIVAEYILKNIKNNLINLIKNKE